MGLLPPRTRFETPIPGRLAECDGAGEEESEEGPASVDEGEEVQDSVNWMDEGEDGVGRELSTVWVEKVLEIVEV